MDWKFKQQLNSTEQILELCYLYLRVSYSGSRWVKIELANSCSEDSQLSGKFIFIKKLLSGKKLKIIFLYFPFEAFKSSQIFNKSYQ